MKPNPKLIVVFLLLAAVAAGAPITQAGGDTTPAATPAKPIPGSMVQPAYPEAEKEAGVEGAVLLACEVGADGLVKKLAAEQQVEGHPAFTAAAIAAVGQWRFEPAREDGKPVACALKIPVKFKLDGDKNGKK